MKYLDHLKLTSIVLYYQKVTCRDIFKVSMTRAKNIHVNHVIKVVSKTDRDHFKTVMSVGFGRITRGSSGKNPFFCTFFQGESEILEFLEFSVELGELFMVSAFVCKVFNAAIITMAALR